MQIDPVISSSQIIRPTYLEIDLGAIGSNLQAIRKSIGQRQIMPILKANAYGHGLIRVAKHLQSLDVPYFGVAYLEEGILLREAGIQTPILVMAGIIGEQIPSFILHNLTICASSIDKLSQIDECAFNLGKRAKVHLKIDTGMERIGIHHYHADSLLKMSIECRHTDIEGIFTHFAQSDNVDDSFTMLQLERFNNVLSFYDKAGIPRPLTHVGNSGAILSKPHSLFDLVRPGILLYGIYPSAEAKKSIHVVPALKWKTKVVYFKVIEKGSTVSYGGTWKAKKMTRIVTLPVGYGDGYFRSMSGKAEVLIRGKRYPVVGAICMDQMMVDIGWDEAFNGDEVILIGNQNEASITAGELAKWAGTIPYEIMTNINTRVPRYYKGEIGE